MSSSAPAQQRLQMISTQLQRPSLRMQEILARNPNDVVITYATRTPLTKAGKGFLKDTPLEGLLIPILQAVREKSSIDPSLVEEIIVGNVLHKDAGFITRASALSSGFPPSTATSTVSRWCSSGLLAVQAIANQITAGSIEIGIAIGAESMSTNPDQGAPPFPEVLLRNADARDTTEPMPWTSENVARDFNISRQIQDEFAALSQQKAAHAQKEGWSSTEIQPLRVDWKNPKSNEIERVLADRDDGVRPGTTVTALSKIRAAFPQWPPSTTTGGNASQVTDGAAALLLMRREVAERLGQPVLGKFVMSTVIGLSPRIMGIGPTFAIPKLLSKLGISKDEVDVFEINEAFASMLVYSVQKLDLDPARVNPRGGAIALGHPLGCTGARQIVTALAELKRTQKHIAVTSMCVGSGMGMASLIVSEQ